MVEQVGFEFSYTLAVAVLVVLGHRHCLLCLLTNNEASVERSELFSNDIFFCHYLTNVSSKKNTSKYYQHRHIGRAELAPDGRIDIRHCSDERDQNDTNDYEISCDDEGKVTDFCISDEGDYVESVADLGDDHDDACDLGLFE